MNRPAFAPRSSSLTNLRSDSTYSLLSSSEKTNGQPHKPAGQPEPLDVLSKLLGETPAAADAKQQDVVTVSVDDAFDDIDFGGLSLVDFAQGDSDIEEASPHPVQSIEECQCQLPFIPCPSAERS